MRSIQKLQFPIQIKSTNQYLFFFSGSGLGVIACIGETLDERNAGRTQAVNERQLSAFAQRITDWSDHCPVDTGLYNAYGHLWRCKYQGGYRYLVVIRLWS